MSHLQTMHAGKKSVQPVAKGDDVADVDDVIEADEDDGGENETVVIIDHSQGSDGEQVLVFAHLG